MSGVIVHDSIQILMPLAVKVLTLRPTDVVGTERGCPPEVGRHNGAIIKACLCLIIPNRGALDGHLNIPRLRDQVAALIWGPLSIRHWVGAWLLLCFEGETR